MHLYALRVLAMATCLSVWVAWWLTHSRYCIKTTKPILKLFQPSGSPKHLGPLTPIPYSRGNPFIGGI